MTKLWHVSDRQGITRFEPRIPTGPDAGVAVPVVWAVDDAHLSNYLLPRDCPRICLRATATTSASDRDRFLGNSSASAVIIIEADWQERVTGAQLWLYELPGASFSCVDANAGYFVSAAPVEPIAVTHLHRPAELLAQRATELRVVERLRPLAAMVAASTLAFSVIRLRNAAA